MDQFLAANGGRIPTKSGTNEPLNKLVVDTKYNNIANIWTPYCRVASCALDRPRAAPAEAGKQPGPPKYFVRLLFNPEGLSEIGQGIVMLAESRFQPLTLGNRTYSVQERFGLKGEEGGIYYPIRYGDLRYAQDPVKHIDFKGVMYINCSMSPETKSGAPVRPFLLDNKGHPVSDPNIFFPGCYVRAQITMFSYSHATGGPGISFRLNGLQFAAAGARMASEFDATAAAQQSAAQMDNPDFGSPPGQPQQQVGWQPPPAQNGGFAQPPGYQPQQAPAGPWQPPGQQQPAYQQQAAIPPQPGGPWQPPGQQQGWQPPGQQQPPAQPGPWQPPGQGQPWQPPQQ